MPLFYKVLMWGSWNKAACSWQNSKCMKCQQTLNQPINCDYLQGLLKLFDRQLYKTSEHLRLPFADPRNIVFLIPVPHRAEKTVVQKKKERQKSLSTRQRSDLQTNRLIPLVLRALMDHLLDLMLIRQETGRPPRGCSIKQPDSSWRNPAVKRTLTGKSLRRAHKKAHTSVYSHTHTHTLSPNIHKQTHWTVYQPNAEAITINGPEGFKSPLSSGFDFLFGWLLRDKLLVKKDYLSREWEITSSSTQQMMSCKHSAVPFFWWSKCCQPLLVSITIVAAPYSPSYIYISQRHYLHSLGKWS